MNIKSKVDPVKKAFSETVIECLSQGLYQEEPLTIMKQMSLTAKSANHIHMKAKRKGFDLTLDLTSIKQQTSNKLEAVSGQTSPIKT